MAKTQKKGGDEGGTPPLRAHPQLPSTLPCGKENVEEEKEESSKGERTNGLSMQMLEATLSEGPSSQGH